MPSHVGGSTLRLAGDKPAEIMRAEVILRAGGLVAIPTETVYGLGANAADDAAVARIFEAKGRPADHPLIVHLADAHQMRQWAHAIPDAAWQLAEKFWPGPLTLILARKPGVAEAASGGLPTIGLRVPGHPVALALLQAFGGGLAAPSANRFGRISPTCAEHVQAELGGRIDAILDGGVCEVGLESTILDLSADRPRVLRPGRITTEAIEAVIGPLSQISPARHVPAPGLLEAHYAPATPLLMVTTAALEGEVAQRADQKVVVLSQQAPVAPCHWIPMPPTALAYGHDLYARLRAADEGNADVILIEQPPMGADWVAVHDRLKRAVAGSGQTV